VFVVIGEGKMPLGTGKANITKVDVDLTTYPVAALKSLLYRTDEKAFSLTSLMNGALCIPEKCNQKEIQLDDKAILV
jgi:hypothetical protein